MKIISSKTCFRDWSSIPTEILILIVGKIVSVDDYVRFSAACRSWYSVAADFHNDQNPQFTPLFVSGIDPDSNRITFRNPATSSTFTVNPFRADLKTSIFVEPAPETPYCIWGSPFGWLILHNRSSRELRLLNPFTLSTIRLPSVPIFWKEEEFIKPFLTASPESDPESCLVFVTRYKFNNYYKDNIYMCRTFGDDDKAWTYEDIYKGVADVTFFKGNLYLITPYSGFQMSVYQFDPHSNSLWNSYLCGINVMPHNNHMGPHIVTQEHLFELNGELCLCLRFYHWNRSVTNEFKVFKIDLSDESLVPLLSLGDHCLFLGNNYSFACKASYPRDKVFEQDGCSELVSDYVFFSYRHNWPIEDYYNRPFDVEVWDMSRSCKVCRKRDARNPLCESLWIVPSINLRKFEDVEECEK